jgi:hypothetical protein
MASGASSSRPTCAVATSVRSSPRPGQRSTAVALPTGSWIEWGGQFQNLKAASQRLAIVVPICFLAIFAVLFLAWGRSARAVSVFLAVPLGLAGGVFALALDRHLLLGFRGGRLHLPRRRRGAERPGGDVQRSGSGSRTGSSFDRAIIEGCMERVRPGDHDRPGAGHRLRAHGAGARHRRRGPEAAGHGRHRRPDHGHDP